jgi:arthrofactin-type cyclic lipopeptide synthetase C
MALPASELPLQYRDFAVWRDRLRGEKLDAEREYWRQASRGADSLDPSGGPNRVPRTDFDGANHSFELPEEAFKIETLCRSQQVTPYMLLLAAFATLIYRRTGADDIPSADRTQPRRASSST